MTYTAIKYVRWICTMTIKTIQDLATRIMMIKVANLTTLRDWEHVYRIFKGHRSADIQSSYKSTMVSFKSKEMPFKLFTELNGRSWNCMLKGQWCCNCDFDQDLWKKTSFIFQFEKLPWWLTVFNGAFLRCTNPMITKNDPPPKHVD